jgi:hypothetical protein
MKRKIALMMALMLIVASLGAVALARGAYLGTMYVVNCNEFVTLRAKPSTSAASITKVAKGQAVEAWSYNGSFCYCTYRGMSGYILSQYLGSYPSGGGSYPSGGYMGTKRVVNCNSWVTLRSRPSTSAGTVTRVPLGAYVEAYYYNTEFAECYYLGMHGYILTAYLN